MDREDTFSASMITKASITAATAQRALAAAEDASASLNGRFTIAVVDEAGNLKALSRQDGASVASIEFAIDKAYTAVAMGFGVSTSDLFALVRDDPQLLAATTGRARLTFLGGGSPIHAGGAVIGAVGVSGGHYTDDIKIAEAAVAAVGTE